LEAEVTGVEAEAVDEIAASTSSLIVRHILRHKAKPCLKKAKPDKKSQIVK